MICSALRVDFLFIRMAINFRVLGSGFDAILVALVMVVVPVCSKWIVAWLTQKTFSMGKKLKDKMAHLKVKFVEGCKKNGYAEEVVLKIWGDWEKFASYAFNKSHATCYSWIAYQTAYLKANFPAEFMAANLTRNKDDIAEISKFMDECKAMGIPVKGPDVNESRLTFVANSKGEIRFGLGGIKGVGEGAVEAIVSEREKNGPFVSIFDFLERVNLNACNRKAVESLILAGAFDYFSEVKREQYFALNDKDELVLDALIRYGNKVQNDKATISNSLFGGIEEVDIAKPSIPPAPDWSTLERLNKEREYVGIYLSAHPLDEFELDLKYGCNAHMIDFKDVDLLRNREIVTGGIITGFRQGMAVSSSPLQSCSACDAIPIRLSESVMSTSKSPMLGLFNKLCQGKILIDIPSVFKNNNKLRHNLLPTSYRA